jgi:hypothetical protein
MKNEPVAWMELYFGEPNNIALTNTELRDSGDIYKTIPLYTHPAKTITDEEILIAIKSIADDVGSYKEYENTYEDGWLDACNTVYDEVFAILRKAQEK